MVKPTTVKNKWSFYRQMDLLPNEIFILIVQLGRFHFKDVYRLCGTCSKLHSIKFSLLRYAHLMSIEKFLIPVEERVQLLLNGTLRRQVYHIGFISGAITSPRQEHNLIDILVDDFFVYSKKALYCRHDDFSSNIIALLHHIVFEDDPYFFKRLKSIGKKSYTEEEFQFILELLVEYRSIEILRYLIENGLAPKIKKKTMVKTFKKIHEMKERFMHHDSRQSHMFFMWVSQRFKFSRPTILARQTGIFKNYILCLSADAFLELANKFKISAYHLVVQGYLNDLLTAMENGPTGTRAYFLLCLFKSRFFTLIFFTHYPEFMKRILYLFDVHILNFLIEECGLELFHLKMFGVDADIYAPMTHENIEYAKILARRLKLYKCHHTESVEVEVYVPDIYFPDDGRHLYM
jgi:hypothetical protein